jgi:SNF2 family DNA or RNA helicase
MPLAYLKYHEEAMPYLWVTKSGIKYQHAREIVRVLGMKYFPQVIATGKDRLIPGFKGYLASYDIFRKLDLAMFKEIGIKTIVLDECQAIKNPDSSRTQCIRNVARDIPKIIPLSGTFWKNRGSEAFVVLNMLDPQRFNSFERFKQEHVEYYYQGSKLKEGGLRKGFIDEIKDIAIRRERAEVLPELPLINRTRLLCEVPQSARDVYNSAQDQLIADYNNAVIGGEEDSFETHQKLMQSLIIMRQIVGLAKVPSTVEFAKEFLEETDRKLVIFVHHKKCGELILNQLSTWCAENDYAKPLSMTADLDSGARFQIQQDFNSDKYRVMVASTLASGEGLNLQTCSDCVMHERQWNASNEEQAEGRFIRIGQKAQSITATYIHGDETIDTHLDQIVENKRLHFHAAMNKGEVPTWNEVDLVKELAAKIASKKK